MAIKDYHFVTHWRLEGTASEVSNILQAPLELPRWWPSVYLKVTELSAGDETGLGGEYDLHTKGWLPYTLRWQFTVTEVDSPRGFSLEARGDFVGRGIWTLKEDGDYVDVTYDWRISAEKPLLRLFSPILKPIFSANHHWAMRQGEESLKRELKDRRSIMQTS